MDRLGPKDRVGPKKFGPKKTFMARLDKNKPEKNASNVGLTRKRQPCYNEMYLK